MNGVLSQPDFLDQVNDRASSSLHPTLSPDGTMLVFCSDRTGGEGGTDLWISTFSNGQWNIPINAGTELNSNANEITPCFLGNDSLLFASNGFGGKGGYDLYITIRKAGEWLPPTPLLHLNSVFDESDPCVLPDGRIIFASNRNGKNRTLYLAPPVSIE
ncbi:MAG: PD40 domain-containing protein [Candidatus Kapabacteria bacterium]|nr:PD40 domain-containing protein [Candidatus Kapabacteria bacterium]